MKVKTYLRKDSSTGFCLNSSWFHTSRKNEFSFLYFSYFINKSSQNPWPRIFKVYFSYFDFKLFRSWELLLTKQENIFSKKIFMWERMQTCGWSNWNIFLKISSCERKCHQLREQQISLRIGKILSFSYKIIKKQTKYIFCKKM